ncbi:16529_t:CDS:2 [Funneliformis caledonium]|uniref:16529_t:CDS:1 n=1 Tax=Funneliformis caledonium TaxID=1117310 RepID=A0A9N9BG96_9GLOM|nr:16529_t:CDS:2 [Funneliformis caledonium]
MSNYATYHLTFGQIEESLGKLCTIKLKNNEKGLKGYLYNIDPVTSTIILLQVENNSIENELPSKYKILVIMHHVVSEFKVNNEENGIPRHLLDKMINQRIEDFKHDSEKMQQRKENLISLFESNRIQTNHTKDDPVVHILDRAHVSPPYVISSIECDNDIILQRVKDMITQLSFN